LDKKWVNRHISVKHQHHKLAETRRPLGMASALALEGFPLLGTHHRGIDDARNIAKIFQKYFGRWKV
ncbi:MAG: 3'-5' exonuclease, partial [Bacteroidota bacterium]